MTVCLDSCLWPPTGHLLFCRSDAVTYTPRDNLPSCFSISYPDIGDCNCDGTVDIGDVVYLIGYLYRGGPPPPATAVGDANCDGIVDVGDVVRLIGYLYRGEPPPSC
ncbi:MAG: dockerin type I repeat-containing protein [Candidatus Zixiibacteriota bacterium]|nr:MAG: dockerin type I repeat-containing protein [candidate division Zixibacteria bacterium]